jgi:iron complex outermembrane receptor protein
LILHDGQSMGDLSSQSADHGVNVDPTTARRIEIVRGPATLLYSANAIGGMINVVTDDVPATPVTGLSGRASIDIASAAGDVGATTDVVWGNGPWVLHGSASGRRAGDVGTPAGDLPNSQSRSAFGNAGVSRTWTNGYVGAHYGYDDSRYGIPVVEEGQVQLTPRRHSVNVRAERRSLGRLFESARGTVGIRRYEHDELEGREVGTTFRNNATELQALAGHRQLGRLKGTLGLWGLVRSFGATGDEALSPPVDHRGFAAFLYEEAAWSRMTLQFGGRFEHASYRPAGGALPSRTFDNASGSVGLLWQLAPPITVAASLARASRRPALEELYFHGLHIGNFAFEVGNSTLDSERALGLDLSVRWRLARVSGDVTYFRNAIDQYIFRNPTGELEEGFPVQRFEAADSLLQGVEASVDLLVTSRLAVEGAFDYVRGELRDGGQALPRMPPLRGRLGLRYQRNTLQAGVEGTAVARQSRVFGAETPTDGYHLLRLYGSYAFQAGRLLHTITVRLDNATDALYRNHLSFIREQVPEMGRNLKLIYSVDF